MDSTFPPKACVLRVIARHADEWNVPSHGDVAWWVETSARLDEACVEVGRDPAQIRRSVQLFIEPAPSTLCCRATNRRTLSNSSAAPRRM